jgi:cytoskeletal protein RodZ
MKTIGKLLKEARVTKRYSLGKVAQKTRIKKEFIENLEKEHWSALPEFPVIVGFVKNISGSLGISTRQAVAFLRRDYPPKPLPINPKPDIGNKFSWSPRLTFLVGVGIVLALILGYLGFQYVKFISPPSLKVDVPKENQTVTSRSLEVAGKTDSDSTVTVNNQSALVEDDGKFQAQISIFEGTTELVVKAISRSGKETVVRRKIIPQLK